MEKTLVVIKPDAYRKRFIGEIISRFEKKSLELLFTRVMTLTEEQVRKQYEAHQNMPFFPNMMEFLRSGRVVALVWQGENAIAVARQLIGETDPRHAAPGTVRCDFGVNKIENAIHASEDKKAVDIETAIYFPPDVLERMGTKETVSEKPQHTRVPV
ncbi:nucleoside-diphosphate kinase [Candidatus Riflebacteria bacterium]